MNEEQLNIELSSIGTVTFSGIIEGTQRYGIGVLVTEENQSTLDTFDSIITTYVLPHYPTTLDKIMEGGSIKAVFIK